MSTKIQHPSRDGSDKTAVHAEAPFTERVFVESCSKHGERLETLDDLEDLTVEQSGMSYELAAPSETVIGYCPECVKTARQQSLDLRDLADREIVIHRIETNFIGYGVGGGFRDLFAPATVAIGDGIAFCPFCGEEFDDGGVNKPDGTATCETHGRLRINVAQEDT